MKSPKQLCKLKLLVIGLDGATWKVIRPMFAAGELPNLQKLLETGCHGDLQSTIPPFSPPAWSSFMTGMNPGKHGIFGFVNYSPQSYSQLDSRMVTAAPLVGRTIFDLLSHFGYRLAALSVPITYPAWPVNGFMVSGEPCPDTDEHLVYPASFANRLYTRYAFPSSFWSKPNDEIIQGLYRMDDARTDLAIELIQQEDLDALFLVLGATDRVQHNFWRFHDPEFGLRLGLPHEARYAAVVRDTYRRADANIGRILAYIAEDTLVMVVSDHGGGAAATRFFHTNAWLQQQGFLKIVRGKDNLANEVHGAVMALRRAMDTPLGNRLRGMLPDRLLNQGRALVRNISQIDWGSTLAYRFPMYPPAEGIVINLAGRQPQGAVQPGQEFETIRREICQQALRITDAENGDRIVEKAYLREELYRGDFSDRAPDVVLILKENYSGGTGLAGPLFSAVNPLNLKKVNGEHRMEGILLANGAMIQPGRMIENARLVDIAPTLLFSQGLPVSDKMDGVILKGLFSADFLKENPEKEACVFAGVDYELANVSLSLEEEMQMEKQLKRLGYL